MYCQYIKHPWPITNAILPSISDSFNSLCRVLFIFPLRYLFAISFLPIFSLKCMKLGWKPLHFWVVVPSNSTPYTAFPCEYNCTQLLLGVLIVCTLANSHLGLSPSMVAIVLHMMANTTSMWLMGLPYNLMKCLSCKSHFQNNSLLAILLPKMPSFTHSTWARSLFTRRYKGNRTLLPFPPLTKMLQFSGCPCSSLRTHHTQNAHVTHTHVYVMQ